MLFSDANVFDSSQAATQVYGLERRLHTPGVVTHLVRAPSGAPSGAAFSFQASKTRAAYIMSWHQGRVIGIVLVFAPHRARPDLERRIGTLLALAGSRQAGRIDQILAAQTAV